MALTRAIAEKMVNAVAADSLCRDAIQPSPIFTVGAAIPMLALEFTGTAGALRNISMLVQLRGEGDPQFDQKICLGIAVVTANAIRKANIAHIKAVATSHRIHWGIHHGATWVRMDEESQYIFDWHPTLDVNNPQVSKHDDWLLAQNSTNFVFFRGMTEIG